MKPKNVDDLIKELHFKDSLRINEFEFVGENVLLRVSDGTCWKLDTDGKEKLLSYLKNRKSVVEKIIENTTIAIEKLKKAK